MKSLFKKIIVAILTSQAKAALAKHKPCIIAVTGSVGKTSTKDAIHVVVASRAVARKSNKSFNSDVGVPLAILGQPNGWNNPFAWIKILLAGARVKNAALGTYPEWLVLEVGADHPGDIRRLTPWLHPDVVVVTMEGDATPGHISFFENKKALVDEDHSIVAAMRTQKESEQNQNGAAGVKSALIVNADDPDSVRASNLARGPVWSIGIEQPAAVRATHYEVAYESVTLPSGNTCERPVGIRFRIEHGGVSVPVERLGVIGMHHMYPSLAAVAVALSQGWNMIAAAETLRQLESTPGRMRVLAGIKGSTIIDDSYNASPIAVKAAVKALLDVRVAAGGRRIAVLGDMRELGKFSEAAHAEVGKLMAELHREGKVHVFAAVGPEARLMHAAAEKAGMPTDAALLYFPHAAACATWLDGVLGAGDVVLIKGSQGVRCERIVKAVMADPRDAEHLLVRQDMAWQGMDV